MKTGGGAPPLRARARTSTASVRAGPGPPTPAAAPPPGRGSFPSPASGRAGAGRRRQPPARAATSFEREAEEAVTGAVGEVDATRVVQGAGEALEVLGQPAVGRRTLRGPGVLGDEVVGALALGDVEGVAGQSLHPL